MIAACQSRIKKQQFYLYYLSELHAHSQLINKYFSSDTQSFCSITILSNIHLLKYPSNCSLILDLSSSRAAQDASVFIYFNNIFQVSSVKSLSCVQFFVTPRTEGDQASMSITNSQSLLKLMSIKLLMPSNHLILCCPLLLLLPSLFSSIRVFSNESVLRIRWPKYWSFNFKHQSFQ